MNGLSLTKRGCYGGPVLDDTTLAALEAALAADPGRRSIRLQLAQALLQGGRPDAALREVRELLRVGAGDVEALGIGAMAADLVGDTSAAEAFAGALRAATHPSAGPALRNRGVDLTVPLVSFLDVDGSADEKRRLELALVRPYRLRRDLPEGLTLPSGILLYGPSSSGKASLAAAIAGELHVNLVRADLATAIDPWGHARPDSISSVFEAAAERGPCVLHLDNIDAVTHRRLRYTPHGCEALPELLAALDAHDPTRVVVVASSAAPWLVSPSLRGPGRLERFVLVGTPDQEARRRAFERSLGRAHGLDQDDLRATADLSEGCTFADIRAVCDRAASLALDESRLSGVVTSIRRDHLRRALHAQARSGWTWFDMAYNFAEFTDDSDEFDPLFDYIRRHVRKMPL